MSTVRFACLLLVLIAGLQVAVPSQAAPSENKKPDYGPVTIDYAHTYGVSLEEAEWRLSRSKYIAAMGHRIEADSPRTFAGIWIEHKPVFRAVVRFVGDAKAQLAKYTQDPLFVPQASPRSYEVLIAAQADIAERLAKDGIDFTSGIDLKKSEVTLYVQDPAMVLRKYAVIFAVSPFIRVYKSGIVTGYNCGDVVDMSHLEIYWPNNDIGSYIEVHNSNNEEMTIGGDSGGPVFSNNAAYGVIHGRPKKNKPDHNDLLFMPIERLSILGVSVLTEPFEITSIPDASGPNGIIEIPVNFKGVPRFPVAVTIEPVDCPPPWQCFPASGEYTTNQPSPLMVGWSCDNDGSLPTTQFTVRTTLQDASLILPPSVEHHVTCIAPLASKARTRRPSGRAGGVIFDQSGH